MTITDEDARKIAKVIEDKRIRRKSLVASWLEGAYSSKELHNRLNERR